MICAENNIVTRILERGLKMFYTKITTHQCEKEKYTHLVICQRCYKYENHPASRRISTTPIYFELADTRHTHEERKNTYKKCINCGNNHRTPSAGCSVRKQAIIKKETKQKKTL